MQAEDVGGQGCIGREEGVGEGVRNRKVCEPKLTQIDSFFCKVRFSHYEIWVQRGGDRGSRGGIPPPPMLVSRSDTSLGLHTFG